MSGLSIETNPPGNPAFPDNGNPGENPSEHDMRLFHNAYNGRLPQESNTRSGLSTGRSVNILESSYAPELKTKAGSPAQRAVLSQTVADFKNQFSEQAQSREGFHALLSQAFGSIDADQAEEIRQWALDGDFSWLPNFELVSGGPSFRGAYSADEGTVFLNEAILADPAEALRVLTEEVGHHLETQVRQGDSPGDEGEVFARTSLGEKINPQELAELRRENDHGIVVLDGETTHVEFDAPPPVELPPVTVTADPDPFDFFDPGGGIDINGIPLGGGFNQPTITDVRFNGGEGIGKIKLRGVDMDILNVTGDGNEVVADGRRFKLKFSNLIERISYYLSNNLVIDGVGFTTEDDFGVTLDRVGGTHNDWVFHIFSTPYDALAQTTGLPWERYDQAYLDLKTRGFDDFANRLQTDGVLPPLGAFEPGSEIETAWRADYDRFLQRTADTQGIPLDAVKESVNDLYTQDPIKASDLLLGKLTTSEVIDAYAGSVLSSDPVTFFRDVYDLAERFDDALKEGTFDYADSTVNLILSLAEWETYDNLAQFSKTLLVSLGDVPSLSVFFPPDEVAEAREQLDAMVAQVREDFTNTWAEAQAEGKEFEQIVKWGITGGLDVATGIITGRAFAHFANKAGDLFDSFTTTSRLVDDAEIRWGFPINDQGADWENYLEGSLGQENRLPPTFKTFDYWDPVSRVATSAKTLNTLTDPRLQNPRQVFSTLKPQIDAAADLDFVEDKGGVFLQAKDIEARELQLAVRESTTAEQWLQIDRALRYAESKNVNLVVNLVK